MRRRAPLLPLALALASLPARAQAEAPPACPEPPVAATAAAPAKVRVMLLDLKGAGPLYAVARSLGQVIAAEAQQVKGFEILSAEEVRAVVEQEANKQLVGCDDTGCLAELAEALDADLLVSGSLEQTADGVPVVSLSLLNTRALVTVNRVTLTWRGDAGRLPDVAKAATQLLVFDREMRAPGTLLLTNVPLDAQVFLDEVDRTAEARSGKIEGLEVGTHVVRIVALDRVPREEHVLLASGDSAQIDGALEPVPIVSSSWFWLGAGAAVAAGVGATATVLYLAGRSDVTAVATVPKYDLSDVESLRAGAR